MMSRRPCTAQPIEAAVETVGGRPPVVGALLSSLAATIAAAIMAAISSSSSLGGSSSGPSTPNRVALATLQCRILPMAPVSPVSSTRTRKAIPAPPAVITKALPMSTSRALASKSNASGGPSGRDVHSMIARLPTSFRPFDTYATTTGQQESLPPLRRPLTNTQACHSEWNEESQ